ncbi:hypothetical protein ACS0PU_006001 [Formica fusca]
MHMWVNVDRLSNIEYRILNPIQLLARRRSLLSRFTFIQFRFSCLVADDNIASRTRFHLEAIDEARSDKDRFSSQGPRVAAGRFDRDFYLDDTTLHRGTDRSAQK